MRIGVEIPSQIGDVGEYLADVSALEAAGVDSIWVDRQLGHDPWMLLAGIAAVTGRVRLAITLRPADARPPEVLFQRLTTLQRLARAGAIVSISAATGPAPFEPAIPLDEIIAVVRRAGASLLVLEATDESGYRRVARVADGVVHPGTLAAASAAFRRVLEHRPREQANTPLELWTRVDGPDTRERWKALLRAGADAGATGVIVPFGPRLLDMLRRPDEEDDRSDLLVALG